MPPRSHPLIEHELLDKRVPPLREENRCPLPDDALPGRRNGPQSTRHLCHPRTHDVAHAPPPQRRAKRRKLVVVGETTAHLPASQAIAGMRPLGGRGGRLCRPEGFSAWSVRTSASQSRP